MLSLSKITSKFSKRYCNWAEEELNKDDIEPTVVKSQAIKAIKDMQREKATGDDNIPVDLFKELWDNWLKIMTILVNKICSGNLPKDFLDVMNNQAKKFNDHRTISLNSHTGKVVVHLLSKS